MILLAVAALMPRMYSISISGSSHTFIVSREPNFIT